MGDNGTTMVIVDGSAFGWTVNLTSHAYAAISDANFFGSDFVESLDTFLLFNKPGTNIFYCSPSNYTNGASGTDLVIAANNAVTSASHSFGPLDAGQTINITSGTGFLVGFYTIISVNLGAATLNNSPGVVGSTGGVWTEGAVFDPLYFAAKVGYPDNLAGIAVQNRLIWLIGAQSTGEIWFDAGAADFPFQIMGGPFIEHGAMAAFSIAKQGGSVFWLSQDAQGTSIVVEGAQLTSTKISTPAIEAAIGSYSVISDAVGFCYEQLGHAFYWLKFPSANNGLGTDWVYDMSTKQWAERSWLNPATCEAEGHRAFCAAFAYGVNIVGDRQNGQLYMLDPNNPTDAGAFIERRRGYPHMMANGARASYPRFIADMAPATSGTTSAPAALPAGLASPVIYPATVTVIDTTFTAPNGTLLQDYFPIWGLADTGSQYTQVDVTNDAEVENGVLTGVGSGSTSYLASGVATSADYIAQFQAVPANYNVAAAAGEVWLMGRANAANAGYQAIVASDGSTYKAKLTITGGSTTTVTMGLITSGLFQVFLSMQGSAISVVVQRSQDGKWLTPAGTWQATFIAAIAITDTTYTAAGDVLIGGVW